MQMQCRRFDVIAVVLSIPDHTADHNHLQQRKNGLGAIVFGSQFRSRIWKKGTYFYFLENVMQFYLNYAHIKPRSFMRLPEIG